MTPVKKLLRSLLIATFASLVSVPNLAAQELGSETNRPIPRFVSMKAVKGHARRGPSMTHRVDWVYSHRNTPLQIVDEYGHWRRVQDVDGAGGWMHSSLLSGARTVIVQTDFTPLRSLPEVGTLPNAYAEQGVIAIVVSCTFDWCKIRAGGAKGWVLKSEIWGVGPEEIL